MIDVTRQLAAFAVSAPPEAFPPQVRHEAKRAFVNWVGCALGGSDHPSTNIALATADAFSGPRHASVLGRTTRLDALNAALLNAMSSSVHTFDDTHLTSITHPTSPVAAAAMAVAEHRASSGAEFLHAIVLGYEVMARVSNGLTQPPAQYNLGLYMTGICGGIGAAVAAGRLLGLNEQQMVWAVGIAAAQAAGLREMHGTMCSGFVPAQAARGGVLAAHLAARDFQSAERGLEGPKGLLHVFATAADPAIVVAGLGRRFELLANTYKAYPCGIAIHPAIDACLKLALSHRPDPDQIEAVELRLHPLGLALTGRQAPSNGLDAQVSVYHWAAASLVHRAAGLKEGSDACVQDPAVIALRERITAVCRDDIPPDGAVVVLRLRTGQVYESRIEHCQGSSAKPLDDCALDDKFRAQAEPLLGAGRADSLLRMCWTMDRLEQAGAVASAAAAGSGSPVA